ncbi:chorion peroxidase [Octopus bimaculoides]|uniref:chorion peroxidase n=1 Tax=Octopus bimaculoides TaxID=37653 RepID=UPI00071D63B2|nr:chorion peroxidase [Octopus bimaculoides]|eukprot:XP_014783201.1 PREDICTED: chorion peroxidase-like [Octopus bimaculoides]
MTFSLKILSFDSMFGISFLNLQQSHQQDLGLKLFHCGLQNYNKHIQLIYSILLFPVTADVFKKAPCDFPLKNSLNTLNARSSHLKRKVAFDSIERHKQLCPFQKVNCIYIYRYRTIDGSCNNLKYPLLGKANTPFIRYIPNSYHDRKGSPRSHDVTGQPLPSARAISTTVFDPNNETVRETDINLFTVFFGQFMSHDFTQFVMGKGDLGAIRVNCCQSENKNKTDCLPISVPTNDSFFSRKNITCLHFLRSTPTTSLSCNSDVRQQLNEATSYIDGSTVYGSSENTLQQVRLYSKGLLKTVPCDLENFPPIDINNQTECSVMPHNRTYPCFFAGDTRVNENPALAVNHIIWLREHNWLAAELARLNPHWGDEKLFQETRKIVSAEIQHIFYNEFLPIIIGSDICVSNNLLSSSRYDYNSKIDPSVENSLATAVFRFGHGMLPDNLLFIDGCPSQYPLCTPQSLLTGNIFKTSQFYTTSTVTPTTVPPFASCPFRIKEDLSQMFEKVDSLFATHTKMAALLKGLLKDKARIASDTMITSAVTERLFGDMDLMARNIQRGRDHGLPPYNKWRRWCGLKPALYFHTKKHGFKDHKHDVVKRFRKIYAHPNDIDLVVGGLTEIPVKGGIVGPTYACIMAKQFHNLKFGDRYWYDQEEVFSEDQLYQIKSTNMHKVLIRTAKLNRVPKSAFHVNSHVNPDVSRNNVVELDLSPWQETIAK